MATHHRAAPLVSVLTLCLGMIAGFAVVDFLFLVVDPLNANPAVSRLLGTAGVSIVASAAVLGLLSRFRGGVSAAWPIFGALFGRGFGVYLWWYFTTHPLINLGEGCFAGC